MKFYKSIRFRIVTSILLFGTLLITLNAGITFFVMGNNMSKMVANLIDTEMDTFIYKYEKDRTTPLPHSKFIDMYEGFEKMPGHFKELVKLLPPGVHTIDDPKKKHPINVGVIQLPDKEIPYFMFFNGREFFKENAWLHPRQILMIFLALLLIPGIIISYITSRMLFAPVVRRAIKDNQYLIENKDIQLHMDVFCDKTVRAREETFYIAVTNLIRNAFYFTSQGSVTITLDEIHIGIQDTGMGIDPGQLESVTHSHVKGETSQGFGLGLNIVLRLFKRFGWNLIIESQTGQGTGVKILWQDT